MCKHLGISALIGKNVKSGNDSAIKEHFYSAITHLILKIFQFSLPTATTLMESLLINRDHPPLNKNKQSLPLEFFDS